MKVLIFKAQKFWQKVAKFSSQKMLKFAGACNKNIVYFFQRFRSRQKHDSAFWKKAFA